MLMRKGQEDVAALLEQNCKFRMGAIVRHKAHPEVKAVVIGRHFQQGQSGVSIAYFISNPGSQCKVCFEIELEEAV